MTRSSAYRGFWEGLREVGRLRSLCVKRAVPADALRRARDRDDALCRAALVLLCSHIEGFFEQLVVDVLQFHEINCTPVRVMPLRLRVTQIWRYIQAAGIAVDEKKWAAIQEVKISGLSDEGGTCSGGMLDAELHTKGFATPGSKEVDILFTSVGLGELWAAIDAKLSVTRSATWLDSLVQRRHPIAHGDQGAKATPKDVLTYIADMRKLAGAFDSVVGERLASAFAVPDPWSLLT
jgi:hypothetical protein